MKIKFFCRLWENIQISSLMKIRPVELSCFMRLACGRVAGKGGGLADTKKLILTFRNLVKTRKKERHKSKMGKMR
jgi:hypothetical protein